MPVLAIQIPGHAPVVHHLDREVVTLGRSSGNDLVLPDPSLSRIHAELRAEGRQVIVLDRGSRNGVRVNGRLVEQSAVLRPGDEILVGQTLIVFDPPSLAGRDASSEAATETPAAGLAGAHPVLVGDSLPMRRVREAIQRVASSHATVLVTGESGTGKELVARLIHAGSTRVTRPFIVVNCPALAGSLLEAELFGVDKGVATDVTARVGRLELADGGTLFLDEIGDLELAAQAKVLRFLQDRSFERVGDRAVRHLDVRIVAATNRDLETAVSAGAFRLDLFHRLRVLALHVPPLRDRPEDLPALVHHFLAVHGHPRVEISPEALAVLAAHPWPGNVRELEHLVQSAVLFGDGRTLGVSDLPEDMRLAAQGSRGADLFDRVAFRGESFWTAVHEPFLRRQLGRDRVQDLLHRAHEHAGPSVSAVARLLGVESQYRKFVDFLRNHGLGVHDPHESRKRRPSVG